MGFDQRDIRRSMDVYTFDNVYLGTVLRVSAATSAPENEPRKSVAPQPSTVSGELLGPMPTQAVGNTGPRVQGAAEHYATQPDSTSLVGHGRFTIGKWWGLLGRRTISLAEVQTVSLERIVLKKR